MCAFARFRCRDRHMHIFALLLVSVAMCILSCGALADGEYQLDPNLIEDVRNAALLWVEQERLPPPDIPLSAKDEARFAEAWARFGVACGNVEKAWTGAFEKDPLFERASACLDRLAELEWQINILRNDFRRQHGERRFREYETQGHAWVKTSGMPWLDLDDTNLARLYLWGEFIVHARDKMQDGKIPSPTYEWMLTTEPYASEVTDADEELTEERALAICRAAIIRQRKLTRDEHEKIAARLDLPRNMLRYLEMRNEVAYMEHLGGTYLGLNLPKHDIRKAEAEFHLAAEKVIAIRPDAMISLHRAHKKHIDELVHEKVREHEAFEASLAAP